MATFEKYAGHLDAYKLACEEHPHLKTFDSSLQEKTTKVLDSITDKAKNKCLSFHGSHKEIYEHLVEVNEAVADIITDSKEDVWGNEDLRTLVKAYFENTNKTREYFLSVQKYVNQAELGQLIIKSAVSEFDKESATGGHYKNKYEKTLGELKKFQGKKEYLDGGKLKDQFDLVKKEQVSLLDQVSNLKTKLDEEYSHIQTCKTVSNVVFGAVFAAVAVFAVATFAFGGVLVLGALTITGAAVGVAAGLALPLTALGWALTYTKLQKMENTLKKQREILAEAEKSLEINKDAMDTISTSVEELITITSRIMQYVDSATDRAEDEVATVFAMERIEKQVDAFTKEIEEVGEVVAKLDKLILKARMKVLEKING